MKISKKMALKCSVKSETDVDNLTKQSNTPNTNFHIFNIIQTWCWFVGSNDLTGALHDL